MNYIYPVKYLSTFQYNYIELYRTIIISYGERIILIIKIFYKL